MASLSVVENNMTNDFMNNLSSINNEMRNKQSELNSSRNNQEQQIQETVSLEMEGQSSNIIENNNNNNQKQVKSIISATSSINQIQKNIQISQQQEEQKVFVEKEQQSDRLNKKESNSSINSSSQNTVITTNTSLTSNSNPSLQKSDEEDNNNNHNGNLTESEEDDSSKNKSSSLLTSSDDSSSSTSSQQQSISNAQSSTLNNQINDNSNQLNNLNNDQNNINENKNAQPIRNKGRSQTYKIERKIGDGCSSIVYLAKGLDEQTNRICQNTLIAVKKFKKRKENHFESEQKILSLVSGDHPNIVRIQSINVPQMEIQQEYYPNGDLLEFVIKRGALQESQARFFIKGICRAIQFIKSKNICHRDLKLENVLLDSNFNPIIIDFAFADINKPNFTEYIGTDGYQAPEIVLKQPYCGHACDNFSLGVMLFEMVMGKPPFSSAKFDQGLYKKFVVNNDEYWEAFKKYQTPSDEAKDLINKLLEMNPAKRISIEEVFQHPWMHDSQPEEQIINSQ